MEPLSIQPEDIIALRKRLSWSQWDLANYLRVKQATIVRMEKGQKPSGPVSKLLEELMTNGAPIAAE